MGRCSRLIGKKDSKNETTIVTKSLKVPPETGRRGRWCALPSKRLLGGMFSMLAFHQAMPAPPPVWPGKIWYSGYVQISLVHLDISDSS